MPTRPLKKRETTGKSSGEIDLLRRSLGLLQRITRTIWSTLDLDTVLKHSIGVVAEATGADAVLLYLYDRERDELVLRASSRPHPNLIGGLSLKMGEGITGWAAKHRESVSVQEKAWKDQRFKLISDLPEDKCEAFLAVPMVRRDRLIGVINAHHNRPHRHSAETLDLVEVVAQQVGGAIENALLYEEARKRAEQLDMLSKVSGAMVSSQYLDEILQLIVSVTANQMRSKVCSLMLLDTDKQALVIAATQSLSEEYRNKAPIPVGQSVSGLAVRDCKAISIRDVQSDGRYAYPDVARKEGLRSLLCVPMMAQGRILGVLNLYTTSIRDFTGEDVRLLQTIANQAAAAIQNTRLLTEAIKMREALETRKLIERAKGIIQNELGLNEDKAFRLIQKKSMDSCKPMKEIAEAIILSHEMRGGVPKTKPRS
jgi:GAF domain-containing protein